MKTRLEIEDKIADIKQEIKDLKSNIKLSYSAIREGIKYYTGYINALEWMIKKEKGYTIAEILVVFIIIIVLLGLTTYSVWFPLIHGAPECIFSKDPIICTQIKIK